MNQQQFEEEQPSSPLRTQRMTEGEAKAVIALWQQEQTDSSGLTTSPRVEDVAEGLDISVNDAQRLLQSVRVRKAAEEKENREEFRRDLASLLLANRSDVSVDRRRERPANFHGVDYGISPPSAEELSETARKEHSSKARDQRVTGYVLVVIIVVMVLVHMIWYTLP